MSDERPDPRESRNSPDEPFPDLKQFVGLRLEFDIHHIARLSVQGPKVPVVDVAPAMGFGRDDKGNYHFLIGGGDYMYPPKALPDALRRLLVGLDSSGGPPAPVTMPAPRDLKNVDGSFMTYEQYERQRNLWHSPVENIGTIWVPLPPALYQALVDLYSGKKFSRPPKK